MYTITIVAVRHELDGCMVDAADAHALRENDIPGRLQSVADDTRRRRRYHALHQVSPSNHLSPSSQQTYL